MSLTQRIFSLFKQDSLSSRFNTSAFDRNIERTLAQNGIPHARQVGGTFELDDNARASLRSVMPQCPPFATATVLVTDRPGEKASAYMAGQLTDGALAIISVQNLGRLQYIQDVTDKLSARRAAHNQRQHLGVIGTLQAKERNNLFVAKL